MLSTILGLLLFMSVVVNLAQASRNLSTLRQLWVTQDAYMEYIRRNGGKPPELPPEMLVAD